MDIKLTQYSHGAGCGCKIAPKVLDEILATSLPKHLDNRLLVGNDTRDDAAVYDLGDGTAVISTTDFFMPIVDDAFDFGRIASINAISDVYAMGGTPLLAIAILGWPVNTIPVEAAARVIDGAREACRSVGIALAGGHSIDSPEPIFGLAVTGRVDIKHLLTNSGARPGDVLYLTKPLGVGVLTTAEKKGLLSDEHRMLARDSMVIANSLGEHLGKQGYVHALTDVTGFGLLGHLLEMCEGSTTSAVLELDRIPVLHAAVHDYIAAGAVPGGTQRNWQSYGHKVDPDLQHHKELLCDPQTSGGLLIAVDAAHTNEFEQFCLDKGQRGVVRIGIMVDAGIRKVTLADAG